MDRELMEQWNDGMVGFIGYYPILIWFLMSIANNATLRYSKNPIFQYSTIPTSY
jgi:hypothetical protein